MRIAVQVFIRIVSTAVLILLLHVVLAQQKILLHAQFENGNGKLIYQNYQQNSLAIAPVIKNQDTEGLWIHAKITGYRTDTVLTLQIPFSTQAYAPNPLVVKNKGEWQRVAAQEFNFYKQYSWIPESDTQTIAIGVPYTYSHLLSFVETLRKNPLTEISTLCLSEKGRQVPLLKIGNPKATNVGFIIARQHAFEAPSSFFVEGFIKYLTSDLPQVKQLLNRCLFVIVPMMDVDNVAEGAYGKDQRPVDFNRNWVEKPHWQAVAQVQQLMLQYANSQKLRFAFDFHAPHPFTKSYSHYYNEFEPNSVKHANLLAIMKLHGEKEGYKLVSQKNNRVKEGECTFNLYAGNPDCRQDRFPCQASMLFSTTYEQSWQSKPDGTPYTPTEVQKSAGNLAESLAEMLLKLKE